MVGYSYEGLMSANPLDLFSNPL